MTTLSVFRRGQVAFFRNTFEKAGFTGGDCINVKAARWVPWLIICLSARLLTAKRHQNKGQATGAPQTNIVMYNNTFVSGGYRQTQTGRGACINYEEGLKACFIITLPLTVNLVTGWLAARRQMLRTWHTATITNMAIRLLYQPVLPYRVYYPATTQRFPSITSSANYLPAGYTLGAVYDGTDVVRVGNPQFVNFPLPTSGHALQDYSAIGGFNFHILSTSPWLVKDIRRLHR